MSATAAAQLVRPDPHCLRIDAHFAAMFLGYALDAGLIEESPDGRYRLTRAGLAAGVGLLAPGDDEEQEA